jgi:hypothetical protein
LNKSKICKSLGKGQGVLVIQNHSKKSEKPKG